MHLQKANEKEAKKKSKDANTQRQAVGKVFWFGVCYRSIDQMTVRI